nr:hypothetical protein CFP56_38904 [Quercus suber]
MLRSEILPSPCFLSSRSVLGIHHPPPIRHIRLQRVVIVPRHRRLVRRRARPLEELIRTLGDVVRTHRVRHATTSGYPARRARQRARGVTLPSRRRRGGGARVALQRACNAAQVRLQEGGVDERGAQSALHDALVREVDGEAQVVPCQQAARAGADLRGVGRRDVLVVRPVQLGEQLGPFAALQRGGARRVERERRDGQGEAAAQDPVARADDSAREGGLVGEEEGVRGAVEVVQGEDVAGREVAEDLEEQFGGEGQEGWGLGLMSFLLLLLQLSFFSPFGLFRVQRNRCSGVDEWLVLVD